MSRLRSPAFLAALQPAASAMPSGALGIWYAKDFATSPRAHVPNSLYPATPASANVFSNSRRAFSGNFWSRYNCTLTDLAAASLDGSTSASTLTASAVDWNLKGAGSWFAAAVATYTLAVDVRWRGTGSANFKMGNYFTGTQLSTKTATGTWARYSVVLTPGVGNGVLAGIGTDNTANTADFEIDNMELYPGSADLGPRADVGHLYFMSQSSVAQPTLSAGSLDLSTKYGVLSLPAAQTLSAFTVIAYGSKLAFNTVDQPMLARLLSTSDFAIDWDNKSSPAISVGGTYRGISNDRETTTNGFHPHAWTYDGTTLAHTLDAVAPPFDSAVSGKTFLAQDFTLNGKGNFGVLGKYAYAALAIWPRVLSAGELATAKALLKDAAVAGGVTAPVNTRWVLSEGDSMTAPAGSYPTIFVANASPKANGINFAVTGAQISNVQSRAAAADALYDQMNIAAGDVAILSVLLGANDLYLAANQGAVDAFVASLQSYCQARRAKGWKVVICTVLPSTRANVNTYRGPVNTILRTWVGLGYADVCCDWAADATMGPDAAASNAALYDGTHPTTAGHVNLEVIYRSAVNAI